MSINWPHSSQKTLCILAPLVALFALGLDFYIPLVPELGQLFQTSEEVMQLTLSGFMFSCAISQIIAGPLCDKYGRRPVAISSLMIFLLGSITGAFAGNFRILLIARLLQAFGASGTFLCAYSTVRDCYPNTQDSAKMYSYINVCISQSPIFAPSIGGYIAQISSWPMVFLSLGIIGLVTLISTFFLYHETVPHKHPVHLKHLKYAYKAVLTNTHFLVYSLAAATGMGSFFMFFSQSPYIIMTLLQYDKTLYGIFFGIVGFSFFTSSLTTNKICRRLGPHYTVELGCFLMASGGLALIVLQQLFAITIIGFIIPMVFVVAGAALTIGAGLAGTMQPFGKIAGVAFSAVGCVKFFLSSLLGMLLMQLPITPQSLGYVILFLSGTASFCCYFFRNTLLDKGTVVQITPTEWD
ncbi:multidrug effflux MFS transporter [Candidatus Synchoanobacter obligatus]|uniref:Bcr/CflA family efflux transporter n=1 Tax=Candidatus Synchoanobacter obligatus TaxID=2919597 RepID=A0ABT1L5G1_9GAMM|nr:multidrug effflux MFS transporter [Candidatus Synchoanobacter obligatus]MCP8352417.1 multidrug effflux MFS transporter [Candidatus Synchoanobacter obligatus]